MNALGVFAHELEHRRAEPTKSFIDLNDQESEEYKTAREMLEDEMKRLTADMLQENPDVVQRAKDVPGERRLPTLWVLIANWYCLGILGSKLCSNT